MSALRSNIGLIPSVSQVMQQDSDKSHRVDPLALDHTAKNDLLRNLQVNMRLGNIKGFTLQKTVMPSCGEEKRYITNTFEHYFIKGAPV